MDDHVAVQVVGQVELLPAARVGAHLGPAFPVDQVHVVLQRSGNFSLRRRRTAESGRKRFTWKLLMAT